MNKARELLAAAIAALETYEADYGEALPDDHELGRVEESRGSPSFRIRAGHLRLWAAALTPPEAVRDAVEALQPFERFPDLANHIQRMASTGQTGSGPQWCSFMDALNASLRSRVPTPAPDAVAGWVLVPEKPTREMSGAFEVASNGSWTSDNASDDPHDHFKTAWSAALSASPPLPLESDNAAKEESNNG